MESQHVLYRIFVPSLQRIQICQKNDFTVLKNDTCLPFLKKLTADISEQWEFGELNKIEYEEPAEETLTRCIFNHFSQTHSEIKLKRP